MSRETKVSHVFHTHAKGYTHANDHVVHVRVRWIMRWWWSLLYSAILHSRADTLHSHVILHEWIAFYKACLNSHWSGVLTALARLVPHETAAVSAHVLCTPYNHAPCHFMQSHICKVYACLAVTCHLHFWKCPNNPTCTNCQSSKCFSWTQQRNLPTIHK